MSDDSNKNDELNDDIHVGGLNESGGDWVQDNKPLLKKVFLVVVAIIFISWGWHYFHQDKKEVKADKQQITTNTYQHQGKIFSFNKPPPPETKVTPISPPPPKETKEAPPPPPVSHVNQTVQPTKTRVSAPMINTSASSMVPNGVSNSDTSTSSSTGLSAHEQAQIVTLQAQQSQLRSERTEPPKTELGSLLQGTETAKVSAKRLTDLDYLLTKGTFINAVLDSKIDSTVAGLTKGTVTHNIYSVNGATLLIPKGSIVTGEYQSGVMQGQARLFVVWQRLLTPSGISIDLSSPSTGSLGGSGIEGAVITNFWKRFGGAIMLSFMNDFGNYLSNMGNSSTYSSTQEAAQQMATESLKNTINIPPTIIVNQGARIGIFVARDINFSNVYQLIQMK